MPGTVLAIYPCNRLTPVLPALLPYARAQAGLVSAVAALRDETLESLRLHRRDQVSQAGVQVAETAGRLGELREDLGLEQGAALLERSLITSRPASTRTSNT